jgi:hypothetical protein
LKHLPGEQGLQFDARAGFFVGLAQRAFGACFRPVP